MVRRAIRTTRGRRSGASRPLEKDVQIQIAASARLVGGVVHVIGTVRRGSKCHNCGAWVQGHMGTQQTEGTPDLVMFLPVRDSSFEGEMVQVWWECKRTGERLRPEQVTFASYCVHAGVTHGWGDLDAFLFFLQSRGLVKAENIPHYRVRLEESQTS